MLYLTPFVSLTDHTRIIISPAKFSTVENTHLLATLVKYDFVVCSSMFLQQRYTETVPCEDSCDIANGVFFLVNAARAKKKTSTSQPCAPLHSELYNDSGKNIAVRIIDKSPDAKNESLLLNDAVRSLKYHYAFLLSSTPIYNRWDDLTGRMILLPGSPFQSLAHFHEGLSNISQNAANVPAPAPTSSIQQLVF